MSKGIGKLLFLTTGVLVGVAVGILYAPDEGSSTRDKLSFQLARYKDRLKELLVKLQAAENHPSSEAKAEGEKIISETRTEAEKLLGQVEAIMDQIKTGSKK